MLLNFCRKIFSPRAQNFILAVIILNAVTLGLETSASAREHFGGLLIFLDHLALGIFVVELTMKIIVLRLRFFKDPWNVFDFLVVGIALVPNSGPLAILRALRILRVLRLINNLPALKIIIESVFRSLPSLGWIFGLLFIIFYIFSVLATSLFGAHFQEWFGSMGATMYTLFQVLTLESWSMGIARPVMEEFPHAYLLFIPFILLTSFIVLNVFIGIIVNTMSSVSEAQKQREQKHNIQTNHLTLLAEFAKLKEQMGKVELLIKEQENRQD